MPDKINLVPDLPVLVKNKAEKNAYIWLRMAEHDGAISRLQYEPVSFKLGRSSKGVVRYVPDFLYIDSETGHLVTLEVKGFRRPNVARGEALFRKVFPWIKNIVVESKVIKTPTKASNSNPFFPGIRVPLEDLKLNVYTEAEYKKMGG